LETKIKYLNFIKQYLSDQEYDGLYNKDRHCCCVFYSGPAECLSDPEISALDIRLNCKPGFLHTCKDDVCVDKDYNRANGYERTCGTCFFEDCTDETICEVAQVED